MIQGRQILSPVLIDIECLDSRIRSVEPGVLCKLDLEKAYQTMMLIGIFYCTCLRGVALGGKWCSSIAHCISTMRFSILVNCTPTDFLV